MDSQPTDWNRYLSGIVSASVDGIVVTDGDGTIRAWNPAAESLYGYSAEEAIGRSILMVAGDRELEEMCRRGRTDDVDAACERVMRTVRELEDHLKPPATEKV